MGLKTLVLINALILASSLSYVYADTFEDSVSLPIPDNVKESFKKCSIVMMDDLTLEYQCNWKFTAEQLKEYYDEMLKEYGLVDPEITAETAQPDEVESVDTTPTSLKQYKHDLERFEDRPPATNADKEYFELLQYLGECQRGYLQSKGIQQSDSFGISHVWVNDGEAWLKSIDYDGRHAKLVKAIEECIAQRTILNPVVLGPMYEHKGAYFGVNQKHHSEMIVHNWEVIPLPDKLTIRDFKDTQERAASICHQNAYYCELEKMRNEAFVDDDTLTVKYNSKAMQKWVEYKREYNLP